MFKKVLLCLLISSGIQMLWAEDRNLTNVEPSALDQRLVKAGIVDQNYKIINQSKLNEMFNEHTKR
ncbi:MAG: hypothetical protein ACKOXD_09320, partial [Acinetobacter sp.]